MSLPAEYSPTPPAALSAAGYSEVSFRDKVTRYARKAGREVIEKALWLHFAARDPKTPVWARTTVYGALAYFILPTDVIPDFLPGAGYTDDLGMLVAAVATVTAYITPEVKAQTTAQLTRWFGDAPPDASA